MENYQLAFIPAENYINKIQLPFGTGVVACYSEEDAMRLTGRRKNFLTKNEWYDIEIPPKNTFLNLDSPIMENSVRAISSLFSDKALAMLFYTEGQKFFNEEIPLYFKNREVPEQKKEEIVRKKLDCFYKSKIEEIKSLVTVSSLIQFITRRARNNDVAVTSSFLSMTGINGIIYSGNNEERILIFDAKRQIKLKYLNSSVLWENK